MGRYDTRMARPLPLSALLSQALVAFTIEFDNEFERRMPHRTTRARISSERGSPWLVSMVMWLSFLRYVPEEGIAARDLARLTRLDRKGITALLRRLSEWGYLAVNREAVVRPTAGGLRAQQVWRPLAAEIERRWNARFGADEFERLKRALRALCGQLPQDLSDYLPILQYGLFSAVPKKGSAPQDEAPGLPALLAKPLLAFALEFESESEISLAIAENVLRFAAQAVRVRDLPRLAGVSKEAIAMSVGFLERHGFAITAIEPGSRSNALTLTPKGLRARTACIARIAAVEAQWQERFGKETIEAVRESLGEIVTEPLSESALYTGMTPHRDCWRAALPRPEALPHFPMVLHRGGYPDGS